MAGSFSIRTLVGFEPVEGVIIRLGKGKKAIDLLGIRKELHSITHIPTGLHLCGPYDFQSQARVVAQQIIDTIGSTLVGEVTPDLFPQELRLYMNVRWYDLKTPPSLEEWTCGPEYEELLRCEDGREPLLTREEAQHIEELQGWDTTLAWFPRQDGPMPGYELRCLIEGRPLYSQSLLDHTNEGD